MADETARVVPVDLLRRQLAAVEAGAFMALRCHIEDAAMAGAAAEALAGTLALAARSARAAGEPLHLRTAIRDWLEAHNETGKLTAAQLDEIADLATESIGPIIVGLQAESGGGSADVHH